MYADFSFYTDVFHGTMPETAFSVFGDRAADEINIRTFDAAMSAPETMKRRVAMACCAVADALFDQSQANTRTGGGAVKSANNDGYSESYSTAEETDKTIERRITAACAKWLTFPVNLMYRGV